MLKISGHGLRLTRGDSTRFVIRILGEEVPDGTKTVFTVKKRAWRYGEAVIEEEYPVKDNKVQVLLAPEVTNIDAGDYVWELKLFLNGEVLTPMEYAAFDVVEAIGNDGTGN